LWRWKKGYKFFSGIQTHWHQLQLMTFGIPKTKEKFHIHHALWYTRYIPRFPRYATNTQV